MLPFLKNRDDGVGVGPVETLKRDHDEQFDLLSAVAVDLLAAVEKKDKKLLKEALELLCMHIQDMDSEQDERMKGE